MQRRSNATQSQNLSKKPNVINKMERNLFDKLDNVFEKEGVATFDDSFNRIPDRNYNNLTYNQSDILSKARHLVTEKNQQNPKFFEEGRQILQQEKIKQDKKKGTFLITAVDMLQPKKQFKNTQQQQDTSEIRNEDDMLRDLIGQDGKPLDDDLAELRRMIQSTKIHMSDYAENVYNLKGNVYGANKNAKQLGYGVNDRIFDDMDRGFYKYMPTGNKNEIFDLQQQKPDKVKRSVSRERVIRKSSTMAGGMKIKRTMK